MHGNDFEMIYHFTSWSLTSFALLRETFLSFRFAVRTPTEWYFVISPFYTETFYRPWMMQCSIVINGYLYIYTSCLMLYIYILYKRIFIAFIPQCPSDDVYRVPRWRNFLAAARILLNVVEFIFLSRL